MRIIIVGLGKIGYSVAHQLQNEGHEITVIDRSEAVVEQVGNQLDVIGCVGNGAVYSVLENAGTKGCDLVLAATASDEVNLLCCFAAHKLGAKHTVARVRDPEYAEQLYAFREALGLSMTLNPEKQTAEEIARILQFPSASRVELFARGRAELVSCRLPEKSCLHGLKLYELPQKFGVKVLICAVCRDGQTFIPGGSFVLNDGDELYMTGAPKEIRKAFSRFELLTHPIHNCMIAGGGRTTYYLSQALAQANISVKIIERDKGTAQQLAELLPKANVLLGDAADHELLNEEGMATADAFVSLTGLDEGNILSAMYAKRCGVRKVIAKVNNDHLLPITRGSSLESVVSPKRVSASLILRYVRALASAEHENNILSLYKLADGHAEAVEFLAGKKAEGLLSVPLKDLKLKKDLLIACLVRNGNAIIPGGTDCILPNDRVLIVTAQQRLKDLTEILEA